LCWRTARQQRQRPNWYGNGQTLLTKRRVSTQYMRMPQEAVSTRYSCASGKPRVSRTRCQSRAAMSPRRSSEPRVSEPASVVASDVAARNSSCVTRQAARQAFQYTHALQCGSARDDGRHERPNGSAVASAQQSQTAVTSVPALLLDYFITPCHDHASLLLP